MVLVTKSIDFYFKSLAVYVFVELTILLCYEYLCQMSLSLPFPPYPFMLYCLLVLSALAYTPMIQTILQER